MTQRTTTTEHPPATQATAPAAGDIEGYSPAAARLDDAAPDSRTAKTICRVPVVVKRLLELGSLEAERLCRAEWNIKGRRWRQLLQLARKALEASANAETAQWRQLLIARLEGEFATATTRNRLTIVQELSKLTGAYAPQQAEMTFTTALDAELQKAITSVDAPCAIEHLPLAPIE